MNASFARLLEFPVVSLRAIDEKSTARIKVAVVRLRDFPAALRHSVHAHLSSTYGLSGEFYLRLIDSLKSEPKQFFFRNEGLLLSVRRLRYDNKTGLLSLEFSDSTLHGLFDGRSTLKAILAVLKFTHTMGGLEDACVRLEIIENLTDSLDAQEIIDARQWRHVTHVAKYIHTASSSRPRKG